MAAGLAAAFLFGVSSPLVKWFLGGMEPIVLAALLYLGAGLGLLSFELLSGRHSVSDENRSETPLHREDGGLLFGVVLTGGILGPVLLFVGLQRLSALVGSLLLNLEAPCTILLATVAFREHLGRREMIAIVLIVIGAGLIGYRPGEIGGDWVGVIAVAGACVSWAVDNNLTQRLSLRDPIVIVRMKTLGAGACTLTVAVATGHHLPESAMLASVLAVGVLSYGVSVVLDVYALRILGAAREAALFATAPFIGAVAAVPLLGDRWTGMVTVAAVIMAGGVALLLTEYHSHWHVHEDTEHDHRHAHADHHDHIHDASIDPCVPHAHRHRHPPLAHDHPHVSELHHRHDH